MQPRVRAVLLASAALVALAPSSGAAALAAHSVPVRSHAAGDQRLTWSVVPSPNKPVIDNELFGVTCLSARSCTAVGRAASKTLVERWNVARGMHRRGKRLGRQHHYQRGPH